MGFTWFYHPNLRGCCKTKSGIVHVGHPRVRELISFSFFQVLVWILCKVQQQPSKFGTNWSWDTAVWGRLKARKASSSVNVTKHTSKALLPMVEKIFWCLYRPSKSTGMRLSTTCFPSGNSTPLGHWTRAHKTCSTWSQVPDTSWNLGAPLM